MFLWLGSGVIWVYVQHPVRYLCTTDYGYLHGTSKAARCFHAHRKMHYLILFCLSSALLEGWCSAQPGSSLALQQLTAFRKNHRRTVDGRLCAAAFVQDDQTYTDCTTATAPNGTSGGEWCYVEVQLLGKGASDWNYCLPPINYDRIRLKSRQAFEMKAAEGEIMLTRLDGSIYRADKARKRLEALCGTRHEAVGSQLELVEKILSRGEKCIKKLAAAFATVESLKTMVKDTRHQVHQQEAIASQRPENCGSVPGYEEDPPADGIHGFYFDNATFDGQPRMRRKDRNIDFAFSGSGPLDDVGGHKYSVRWDGFILIPRTAHYVFSTETDNGARVFLNDQPITADRMPMGTSAEATGSKRVPLLPIAERAGLHSANSPPVRLTGKQKYKIRVEFVHNTHFFVGNSDHGNIKLSWASEDMLKETVPAKYFFTADHPSPIKVSGLDPKLYSLSLLFDGSLAFSDKPNFRVQGVPAHMQGARYIRSSQSPAMELVEFRVNVPTNLHVGYPANAAFPFAPFEAYLWKAHDTGETLSVQEKELQPFAFKRIFHRGGPISFSVLHVGTPFLIALSSVEQASSACGGEETNLSLSSGDHFFSCFSSSQETPAFGCKAALSGIHMDAPHGIWRTGSGNGNGEFISLTFGQPVQVVRFLFVPPADSLMWPSEITLTFDDDETEVFSILHSGKLEHHSYLLAAPKVVTVIKAEITQMYVSGSDSGGSFEFWGVPCSRREEESSLPPPVHELECLDTLSNALEGRAPEPGFQFIAVCPAKCFEEKGSAAGGPVYGLKSYAVESSICTAALHAGVCAKGAACEAFVTVTGPQTSFAATENNGVLSFTHGPAEKSIALAHASCTHSLLRVPPAKLKIHFGVSKEPLPQGWLADEGHVKQRRGPHMFGWLEQAAAPACASPKFSNLLSTGGLLFASAAALYATHPEPLPAAALPPPNFWSASVPHNGKYLVAVELGNPCGGGIGREEEAAVAFLEVNGQPLAQKLTIQKNKFYTATAFVEVREKLIILTSSCGNLAANVKNRKSCEHAAATTIFNVTIEEL